MYDDANSLEAIARKDYSVDIGGFLSRGWEIFTQNPLGFIGFCILTVVISFVLSYIPFIGTIANIVISYVLPAGYYIVAFKISRGQLSEFGDFFKGFQNTYFLPVFLATLVVSIFVGVLCLPFLVGAVLSFYGIFQQMAAQSGDPSLPDLSIPGALTGALLVLGLILLIPAIYLGIAYTFSIPLIVDRKADFWSAMETSRKLITRHWFPFFGFSIVLGLINFAGVLACGVGALFTIPLTICAIAAAYENIIGLTPES
ncbi:MAG: DUF975 family protein [Aphanocapsa sp. GSE-SYN-MK-11-07L]|jgi:uncharacterized membrane protein|nr:DUF975 family protein [Aphanocapsa sp. GSE-SYN-MK-11-07L]